MKKKQKQYSFIDILSLFSRTMNISEWLIQKHGQSKEYIILSIQTMHDDPF